MNESIEPTFQSDFLAGVFLRLKARRKALATKGAIELDWNSGPAECITVALRVRSHFLVSVKLKENNRADLSVRSLRRTDRGRVLLQLDEIKLPGNPKNIVSAIEETATLVGRATDVGAFYGDVYSLWQEISMRAL